MAARRIRAPIIVPARAAGRDNPGAAVAPTDRPQPAAWSLP
jgi:hypothetical protein